MDATHHSIAITPDGRRALITDYGFADMLNVLDIEPGSDTYNRVVAGVYLGDTNTFAEGVAVSTDGRHAYVVDSSGLEKVYVIDIDLKSATVYTIVNEITLSPLNNDPHQAILSVDGGRLYVSRNTQIAVIDADVQSPTYHDIVERLSPREPALWGQASMAITSDDRTLLVVNQYQDSVSIYDIESGVERQTIPVGNDPLGIALVQKTSIDFGSDVIVVNEGGVPVQGFQVYRNGVLAGFSNEQGRVSIDGLAAGDELAALLEVYEEEGQRSAHAAGNDGKDWSYRIYITSMTRPTMDADAQPLVVVEDEQPILTLDQQSVLVLFNLVISIEWNATPTYIAEIVEAARQTSTYLYDATDGQMIIGHVTIRDKKESWRDADIQIMAHNGVRPHALVSGILSSDDADVVRVGRYWDAISGRGILGSA